MIPYQKFRSRDRGAFQVKLDVQVIVIWDLEVFRSRNQDTLLFKHIRDGIVMPSLESFDLVIKVLFLRISK